MKRNCNDNKPLVSVLLAVYNVESYIEKCCKSLFEQTYDNLEFIFVDDKSPDNSFEILQQVLAKYPSRKKQVHIIHHEKNKGLAASRNTSVMAASGEFVMFVDPDDWIEPNSVELLVDKQVRTDADIVYGQVFIHHPNYVEHSIEPEYADKNAMALHYTQLTVDHTMWKRLIRRSLFETYHLRWHEGWNHGEDHYMMPQLTWYASKVERIDESIYHYNRTRENSGLCSLKRVKKDWDNELDIISFLTTFFDGKDERIVESLKETKVRYLIGCLGLAYSNRMRRKYNEIASMLYSMPEPYLSKAWFSNADERLICRFYESRLLFRGVFKSLSKIYSISRVNH